MDTMEYDGARIRLIRFNHHMSYWKLLGLLWILSSWSDANNQSEVITCGEDAKFPWTGDVPPFIVIQWYFNDRQIAQTYNESLSQDTLLITEDYKDRFRLNRTGYVGFYIKNARENDSGEYKCTITMKGTGNVRVQQKSLQVIDEEEPESGEEQPHTSGEEQPHASDSPANVHPAAVAVPVGLGVMFVVFVAVVIKRKDVPAAGNHVESRSERSELEKLDVEIKSPVENAVENGMGSQILMKDTEA